jgi:protein tyrosine phosphatase (PTP) superfamily phosphohydrolase (DUF442 family)
MSIEDIKNYKSVTEALASSGQPDELQFKEIAAAGFDVVINLAMPNSENALRDEGCIVTAGKMVYAHIPVPFDAPDVEHLRFFFGLMNVFEEKKCWVHCVANYRVSAFLYQYFRLVRNVSADEAKKVIFAEWNPNQVWQDFMALEAEDVGL